MGTPDDKQTWLGRLGVTAFTSSAAGDNRAPAGAGRDGSEVAKDITNRIGDKIKADGDLRVELATLSRMDMKTLLEIEIPIPGT